LDLGEDGQDGSFSPTALDPLDADPPRASVSAEEGERERERKVGELSEADRSRQRERGEKVTCG
jgi:hypothetical protein